MSVRMTGGGMFGLARFGIVKRILDEVRLQSVEYRGY